MNCSLLLIGFEISHYLTVCCLPAKKLQVSRLYVRELAWIRTLPLTIGLFQTSDISKLIKCIVVCQLTAYLNDINLLPSAHLPCPHTVLNILQTLHCCTSHSIFLMLLIRLTSLFWHFLILVPLLTALIMPFFSQLRKIYVIGSMALSWIAFFLVNSIRSASFNSSKSATSD